MKTAVYETKTSRLAAGTIATSYGEIKIVNSSDTTVACMVGNCTRKVGKCMGESLFSCIDCSSTEECLQYFLGNR